MVPFIRRMKINEFLNNRMNEMWKRRIDSDEVSDFLFYTMLCFLFPQKDILRLVEEFFLGHNLSGCICVSGVKRDQCE